MTFEARRKQYEAEFEAAKAEHTMHSAEAERYLIEMYRLQGRVKALEDIINDSVGQSVNEQDATATTITAEPEAQV